ncbi:hypothetical protein LEP1GSC161_1571 [Leptospira santarosai str. CBC1416]|uniref:Uncharacterized protein n=1 Tax=Leptospira santarosai str. CBC1416 TaxID=1193059 RepID=M6VL76_9LEPT|nr:hypothetical protein LEP1GSC161_1571 [Leptospira santarosai str. CBC1416]
MRAAIFVCGSDCKFRALYKIPKITVVRIKFPNKIVTWRPSYNEQYIL